MCPGREHDARRAAAYMNGGFGPRPAATATLLSLLQNRQQSGSAVLPEAPSIAIAANCGGR
jgi:hypothetical protein